MKNNKNLAGSEFYFDVHNPLKYFKNFQSIPNLFKKRINISSVLSILMKSYTIDMETNVKDVKCSPWMASSFLDLSKCRKNLPKHFKAKTDLDEVAAQLKKRLSIEALKFLKDKNSIGILLTGGMDSRVVAGVIKDLQFNKKYKGRVIALTWGIKKSRDVVYSKKIAKKFHWQFKNFKIEPEILKENIFISAERGSLYSPVHLHAMKDVSNISGLDGIIAASYGDSVGRAEFSGVNVKNLPDILSKNLNSFSFLLEGAKKYGVKRLKTILKKTRNRFPGRNEKEYREIEQQMNYMRRSLNSCMQIINEKIPLYQMFTDIKVYSYMWSLDYSLRTNEVYTHLLKKLPGKLINIPWARTGKKYNQIGFKKKDSFLSNYHHYGVWLRNDIRNFVIEKILNGNLQKIGIFNNLSLKVFCKIWKKDNSLSNPDRLDEQMAWLASFSIFIEKYNLKPDKKFKYSLKDLIGTFRSIIYYNMYFYVRKILKIFK